jgi:spore coat protein A, manganese oxidase
MSVSLTRRNALKAGLLGSAALMLPLERTVRTQLAIANPLDPRKFPKLGQLPFRVPPEAQPTRGTIKVPGRYIEHTHPAGNDLVDIEVDFYEQGMLQRSAQILPGLPQTMFWGYGGSIPGPTFHAERGRPVVVRNWNRLYEQHPVLMYGPPSTSVHLHGNPSLPEHDGYASDVTDTSQYKDYWYPMHSDARTLWYHDHGVHHTASNAYMGLAGQFLLHDSTERASGLPLREHGNDMYGNPYDCPFVLRDALFDANAQLLFDDSDESGLYGDINLVNGVPWPLMRVEARKYRFRVLNGALSRSYQLDIRVQGSSTKLPFHVVATDGGLTQYPIETTTLRSSMGERYELVIDFAKYAGKTIVMKNVSPKNNVDFDRTNDIMVFQVGAAGAMKSTAGNFGGAAMSTTRALRPTAPEPMQLQRSQAVKTREFRFKRNDATNMWTIDDKTWDDVVSSGYREALAQPKLNSVEIWRFVNNSGGWFHPIHVHLIDFKILKRSSSNINRVQPYENGAKDVVYLGEGEEVEVIARFGPRPGRYMIHCHNLIHEDHDMMHQFWVRGEGEDDWDGHDPMGMTADKMHDDGTLCLGEFSDDVEQLPPGYTERWD